MTTRHCERSGDLLPVPNTDSADLQLSGGEEWRPIPRHASYQASSVGRIRSIDRELTDGRYWKGRIMVQKNVPRGYRMIALSLGTRGEYRHIGVHTLIAEAFHGPRPTPEHQVAHFDGNPSNNCASNLRWATAAENAQDRDRHGKTFHPRGILHPNAKLTDEMVRTMRRMKSSGIASVDDLVRMSNVSRSTIFDALSGRTWSHL